MSKLSKHQVLGVIVASAIIILLLPWLLHDTQQFKGLDPRLKFPDPPPAPVVEGDQQAAKNWVLQVASFADLVKANKLVQQLQQDGFNSYIQTASAADGKILQAVYVGPLRSRGAAERLKQKLKTNPNLMAEG